MFFCEVGIFEDVPLLWRIPSLGICKSFMIPNLAVKWHREGMKGFESQGRAVRKMNSLRSLQFPSSCALNLQGTKYSGSSVLPRSSFSTPSLYLPCLPAGDLVGGRSHWERRPRSAVDSLTRCTCQIRKRISCSLSSVWRPGNVFLLLTGLCLVL